MHKISLLDCTLRDGGYINDWNFSFSNIKKIIKCLEESNIEIIECGYINNKDIRQSDSTLFNDLSIIDDILKNHNNSVEKVVMANLGDFDIEKIVPKCESKIDGIRLAFHQNHLDDALDITRKIIQLGYKLYFQPMITKNYSDLEFLSMIQKVNSLNIHAFYIVDSFGSMTLDEFNKYLILANHNLNEGITLGYHAHNNMQLAFSNAISMCHSNTLKRDIIIDSSIYGIGRGAGNLNTELIADYLNKSFQKIYDTLPLLEVIDELLSFMIKRTSWGFSPAQFLSASFNCHPNYATYLINKNTNHIVGIKKIMEKLPENKKASFDRMLIEKLYIESILEVKSHIKIDLRLDLNKKVLLIASGKSINSFIELLKDKEINDKYILIALNHIPKINCDYYFFSNQKRYDEFYKDIDCHKTIITNNIKENTEAVNILDFSKFVFLNDKLVTNVAIVAINYLISIGVTEVEIAGLDGYRLHHDNYNYEETSFISDPKVLSEENELLKESLTLLKMSITIRFITPTLFDDAKTSLKILGVIPARYKSSRFDGKPLCLIKGVQMVKRTYLQAKKSNLLDELVVATESEKIKEYCESENIPVVMTSDRCLTGTDRIAEVAKIMDYDLYVNIQGDEPVIDPMSINEIIDEYKKYGDTYAAYNLYKYIDDKDEVMTDTIIKVIVNEKDELMYMSRLGIPFNKSNQVPRHKKQICVYGFTKKALENFTSRDKTLNEQFEDIEILRFIDMGYKVKMKETFVSSIAVDIPEDVRKVEIFLDQNGLD